MLDGQTLLAATAAEATTFYLPGIGEKKQAWSYSLVDGTNSVRQMTGPQGQVTLTRSFTPWGELLQLTGAGDFTQGFSLGYLGGLLDAATGLIYVGSGQYYDPATGRFLSRGVYPGASNPYVPWQGDPLGWPDSTIEEEGYTLERSTEGQRTGYEYDAMGRLTVVYLPNGVTGTDTDNRL